MHFPLKRMIASGLPVVSAAVFFSMGSASAQAPSTVDPGQIQQRFEEPKLPKATREPLVIEGEGQQLAPDSKIKFPLGEVDVRGSSVYSQEDFRPLYADYLGKQVGFADLNAIARAITAHYRNNG